LLFAAGYAWKGVYFTAYSVVMYERNSRALMYNGIFSTWSQVVIIILLSSWIGLEGALIGTALGKLIQSYGLYFRSGASKMKGISKMKLHALPSVYAGLLLVLFYVPFTESMVLKGAVAFVLACGAILLVFRKEVPQAVLMVKKQIGLAPKGEDE
jgi:O-antigen/teichoic acid export membrane protein